MSEEAEKSRRGTVTISITTHNRSEDLVHTLRQLARLVPAPLEIIVCADGCADGTQERVRTEFPQVRLLENNPGRGSVYSRDRIIREARGELVLSLDDDSYPVEDGFLGEVDQIFANDETLALLTFPQRSDEFPESLTQASFGESLVVGSYTSSGTVIRRSVYLSLSGFPEIFFHAYEEPDFTLQCVAADFRAVFYTGLTVRHHYSSAQRDEVRTHHRHARNECWSVLMRCPLWAVPAMVLFRAVRQARYTAGRGWPWLRREPQWWRAAAAGARAAWRLRAPVPWSAYWRWCRLMREPEPVAMRRPQDLSETHAESRS
ncbi:MAG: glycosyltransferase family 2 protein [Opitutales bacterium]|nr:glycosyltransferase family 2 protein [Opitutales bacterium]